MPLKVLLLLLLLFVVVVVGVGVGVWTPLETLKRQLTSRGKTPCF